MPLSNPVPQYIAAAVTTAGVLGGAYYAYRLQRNKLPEQWREVGYVKDLYAYPVKSIAPVIMKQAECSELGVKDGWLRDRNLMIVDAADNNCITARAYPEMLLIQPSYRGALLTLKNPEMESIEINLAEVMVTQKPQRATVWRANVPVYDCGEEVSKWITKFLNREGTTFRLVYYASQKPRPFVHGPRILYQKCRYEDASAFSDEVSYNLISETSVDDLNTRMNGTKVSPLSFRPNFNVSGVALPYDEDNWKYVKIGENVFEVLKPCTRCILPNIDPETGIRNEFNEPLTTLRSYRLIKDPKLRAAAGMSPCMGVQMALRSGPGGIVSINDRVYVA